VTSIIKEGKLRLMKNKIKSRRNESVKRKSVQKEACQKIQKDGSFSASDF